MLIQDSEKFGFRHELELWRRRDHDPRAREKLVLHYEPHARRMALKYATHRETTDDLIQVAMVGLMNAVNRFDPEGGHNFISFAAPTIQGELKRYFRDKTWMIRLPRSLQEEIASIDAATDELGAELHRTPTNEELEDRARLEEGAVSRAATARQIRIPSSFDVPVAEDGISESERVGDEDSGFGSVDDRDQVRGFLEALTDEQQLVIRLRFSEDMTQSEIAERIGCSQMHVSRLIKRSVQAIIDQN